MEARGRFALGQRLPTFCEFRSLAQAGCLASHAVNRDEGNMRECVAIRAAAATVRFRTPGERR
jgi:hypothetical protein